MSIGGPLTESKITEFLEMLSDGKWHKLDEIQRKMRLKEADIRQILSFLGEYNFILIEETKRAIKLEESARRFLSCSSSS